MAQAPMHGKENSHQGQPLDTQSTFQAAMALAALTSGGAGPMRAAPPVMASEAMVPAAGGYYVFIPKPMVVDMA